MSRDPTPRPTPELDPEVGEVDADEIAEASELARLLAGRSGVDLSNGTMEGVGLLRVARHTELEPEAFARIEGELLNGRVGGATEQAPASWRKAWWWLLAAVTPAAAALFLVLEATSVPDAQISNLVQLPPPDVRVLEAQASWVTSDAERPIFEREMRDYRAQVLASLDTR